MRPRITKSKLRGGFLGDEFVGSFNDRAQWICIRKLQNNHCYGVDALPLKGARGSVLRGILREMLRLVLR
jgi:hypothetical protein